MANDGNQRAADADDTKTGQRATNADRRTFLKATGLGATGVAAGLAGCTGPSDGSDGGGGDGGGGGLPSTIRIGALGPADASFGASILNSAKLAAEKMNSNNGIGGSDVEVVTADTKDNPQTARQRYGEMTSGGNPVHGTVGIFGSEQLLALMGNIAQKQTPHLTAGAATPEAPKKLKQNYDKFKYWFRVGPVNSTFLGDSLIEYAKAKFESMGWQRVAFIAEDFKWTEPVTQTVKNKLESETNVTVTSTRRISEGAGSGEFSSIYDQLESENVDGCYTALAHIGSTSLVTWAKEKRPFGYGGIHVPTQLPSYFDQTKGAAIATFSQTTATPTSEITSKTVPYANAYMEKYDKYPVYSGYSAYDAMYMLKKAIESTGSVNGDDLVSELENMTYTGTSGNIAFYGKNKQFPHDVKYGPEFAQGVYFQWQTNQNGEGVQRVIWPDDLAGAEYKQPPWLRSQQ